jgi:hypothetical protein
MDWFERLSAGTISISIWVLLVQGIPIALIFFAIVLFMWCTNPERQFRLRYFLLYGPGGILVGALAGFLLVHLVTGQADDCEWFETPIIKPGNYSAEEVAEAKRQFETMKCPEFLENYKKVEGVVLAGVPIVSSIAPSVGLWAGSRLMPRRRQSRQ